MLASVDKIDLTSRTPQGARRLMLVVEEGEWNLPDALGLLQEKLNAYACFALDGQMVQMYPESAGKRVIIAVCPVEPVPQDVDAFLTKARAVLEAEGITLTVEPLPAAEAA